MTNFERKRNDGPPGVHLAIRLELLAGIRAAVVETPLEQRRTSGGKRPNLKVRKRSKNY